MSAGIADRVLDDDGEAFDALVLEPARPRAVVLFAVGSGGDPGRHLELLRSLADQGCIVAAPRFGRLVSTKPSAFELQTRARRLKLAFDAADHPHLPAAGVGHSIGSTLLLILAGARAVTAAGETVQAPALRRLSTLALMAPAMDFFQAPGALRDIQASMTAWVGDKDAITPPQKANGLKDGASDARAVDLRIVPDAGHFSFMNAPPPHAADDMADREAFLDRLSLEVARVILG